MTETEIETMEAYLEYACEEAKATEVPATGELTYSHQHEFIEAQNDD
jgi:hypothetical protein